MTEGEDTPIERNQTASCMQSPPGTEVKIDGKMVLYFGGTSYFCLHGHKDTIQAGVAAWQQYGTNTATIRGGVGTAPPHLDVELAVAQFFGTEAAIYVASGYLSNLAGLQGLQTQFAFDVVLVDIFFKGI